MVVLRKLLFPFAILYGLVTAIRNWLYDNQIFRSKSFDIPVIAVGNLSVGGTGKSPQIEYLIRLLSPNYKLAVLSRGYKRSTDGFVLADETASAKTLGDEPYQFHRKFPNVIVAVDANRTNGINELLKHNPDVILLDDAFQHRKVKAGFYILLTAYNDLYADDFILPMGNLRESRQGAERADVIIVTKCPPDLSQAARNAIRKRLRPKNNQTVFFTTISYDSHAAGPNGSIAVEALRSQRKLVVAGIAKPKPFFEHLRGSHDTVMEFPDHHIFSEREISVIRGKANGNIIVTTEKDFVRLEEKLKGERLYQLPITTQFLADGPKFAEMIYDVVAK